MLDVFVDALLDSLKILAMVFAFEVLLSFLESKIAHILERNSKLAPVLGAVFGIVPQCGVSVVAADLYSKRHVTIGTLIAVFLACSDEALPILFTNFTSSWWLAFLLIGLKILIGAFAGLLIDLICARRRKEVESHFEHCPGEEEIHIGCCGHEIEAEHESPWKKHLLHPVIHSLKVFAYVFVINFAFGSLFFILEQNGVGQEQVASFFADNRYWSPIIASLIGLIPNCVSSVMLSNLFVQGLANGTHLLPFGALLAGLLVNAGLGMLVLAKKKEDRKSALLVLLVCVAVAIASGYIALFAFPNF